jgi:hypothetical protein
MSKSNRIPILAAMTLLLPLAIPGALPQTSQPLDQESALSFTHDFLQTFYPDVFAKGTQLTLTVSHPANSSWRQIYGVYFRVTPKVPLEINPLIALDKIGQAKQASNPTLLGGLFWFRPQVYGRIEQMVASFDVVHQQQLEAIRELVRSHPGWSQEQAIQALRDAGARYGPSEKQQFLSSLHLERAERFLGRPEIKLVEFQQLGEDRTGSFAATAFVWTVQAIGVFPDGTREAYGFTFEPFEGKLIGISHINSGSSALRN